MPCHTVWLLYAGMLVASQALLEETPTLMTAISGKRSAVTSAAVLAISRLSRRSS